MNRIKWSLTMCIIGMVGFLFPWFEIQMPFKFMPVKEMKGIDIKDGQIFLIIAVIVLMAILGNLFREIKKEIPSRIYAIFATLLSGVLMVGVVDKLMTSASLKGVESAYGIYMVLIGFLFVTILQLVYVFTRK